MISVDMVASSQVTQVPKSLDNGDFYGQDNGNDVNINNDRTDYFTPFACIRSNNTRLEIKKCRSAPPPIPVVPIWLLMFGAVGAVSPA